MKKENLKISVLMPVYNEAPYLNECIDSILTQTEHFWELICVDDFSTDSSFEILSNYAERDSRVLVARNEEKGIISALRKALALSSGHLISRMDADDVMHEEKLEALKKSLISSGEDYVATGWVKYFSEDIVNDGYNQYAKWLNGLTQMANNFSEIYKECVIPSPCWMLYRSDLVKIGAFDLNTYPEDYDLVFRMYKHDFKISPVTKEIHYWRDHPARASRNDVHYSDQSFLALKLPYFFELDYDDGRQLILWGAGKKAKSVAKHLMDFDPNFIWISNNPKKIGHRIYGKEIFGLNTLSSASPKQVIVSVSGPREKIEIMEFLNKMENDLRYFFFY